MWRISTPTRVSRFYPLFSITLLIFSSVLFYAWQSTQIELNNLSQIYSTRQANLIQQVSSLTASQKQNSAKLQVEEAQITKQLTELKNLQDQTDQQKTALVESQKKLTEAQTSATKQQDQLAQNATELQQLRARPPLFSFSNQSSLRNIDSQEADIKDLVSNAYTYIQQLYGQPYLLNQITITFVNNFTISEAAGEIIISNGPKGISVNIHLKSFDKNNFQDSNTVIHEMVHAFHGIAVLETSALEEGMTVAATDVIMQNMINDGKLQHFPRLYLATTDSQYSTYNSILTVSKNSSAFYSDPNISEIYQMLGVAWTKLYNENHNFFKEMNDYYYPLIQKGGTADIPTVIAAIKHVDPSIAGQPIDSFLAANRAFNPS